MNGIQTWGESVSSSLLGLWERFLNFLPLLLGALVVFVIGWILAVAIGKIVEKIVRASRLDKGMEKFGWENKLHKVGIEMSASEFFGKLVKWFLVLVFLMAATDILNLDQVTDFLNSIILYIPNVVVAVVILAIVLLVGNFVYKVVKESARTIGVMSATLLASISKWAIIVFGILAALLQLGIATSLVSTIFMGLVAMLALAGGLAFGLGGKDEAKRMLEKLREEITQK